MSGTKPAGKPTTTSADSPEERIPLKDVMDLASCSRETAASACRSGELRAEKTADGAWMIRREDALAWVEERRRRAEEAKSSGPCMKQESTKPLPYGLDPVRDPETARERGRAGGLASAASRRRRKAIREYLDIGLRRQDEESGELNAMAMSMSMIREAKNGNVRAFLAVLEALGERGAAVIDHRSTDGSMSPGRQDLTALSFDQLMALTSAEWAPDDADLLSGASGGEAGQ